MLTLYNRCAVEVVRGCYMVDEKLYRGLSNGLEIKRIKQEKGYSRGQVGEVQSSGVLMFRKRCGI